MFDPAQHDVKYIFILLTTELNSFLSWFTPPQNEPLWSPRPLRHSRWAWAARRCCRRLSLEQSLPSGCPLSENRHHIACTLPSLSIDPRDKFQKNIFLGLDHFMIYEPRQDFICDRNPSWTPFWGFFEQNVFSANKIKLSLPHLYI